jgi:hypothetical protein
MTINRTTLLDLPLPVTGTESGTWGDVTNNGLAQYVDIAVAGMNALTSSDFTAGALTISNTLGTSAATNIAAGSAQYATIKVSSLAQNSTITAPASNRSYRIINADSTYNLTIKASGQTGITFLPGQTGVVAFTGTDYEVVGVVNAASSTDNAVPKFDGTTGQIIQNTGVTIDDSNNVSGVAQLNATTADLTNIEVTNIKAKDGTSAGSIADSTGVVTLASSVLTTTDINGGTIDGAVIGGSSAAAGSFTSLSTSGAVVFNDAGADVDFRVEGDTDANLLFVDASTDRVGIGTSTPTSKLEVYTGTGAFNAVQAQFNASNTPIVFACNNSNGDAYLGHNTVQVSGTDGQTYAVTNAAAKIRMNGGNFQFNIAPSGTAGNPISFTQAMTLDSSGNLGLGVTPSATDLPHFQLQDNGFITASASLFVSNNARYSGGAFKYVASSLTTYQYVMNSGGHQWLTAPSGTAGDAITFTQAMTLDASGNLLVGKTATAFSTAGTVLYPNGTADFIANGDVAIDINRLVDDGSLIRFYQAGTTVGSIGTTGGELYIDFGGSTGGAVTSRTLDDYEEGTFTPAFSSSGAVFAYTSQQGSYTKIGRQVCFNIYLQLDGAQTLTANVVTITGLPFTSATISGLSVAMVCGIREVNLTAGASILVARIGSNSSSILLVEEGDNYATTNLNSNQLSGSSGQVMISGTYPAT